MQAYLVRRILVVFPILLVVAVLVFVLLRVIPGDAARSIVGVEATIEDVAAVRETLGLNEPMAVQFFKWFGNVLKGDFGMSFVSNTSVMSEIVKKAGPTISITLLTELVVITIAVPMGVLAAWKAGSSFDRAVMVFAAIGFSMPVFWIGYMLIWVFGVWGFGQETGVLPIVGYSPLSEGLIEYIKHLILPVATLALASIALLARITRASTLNILREDYIRTARAKGLAEKIVLVRHAVRNAALPVATVIGLEIAGLLSGVVVTESVFAIPGLGRLVVTAMTVRDYPVIQGTILVVATAYVFVNLIVDVTYAVLDPRVRY